MAAADGVISKSFILGTFPRRHAEQNSFVGAFRIGSSVRNAAARNRNTYQCRACRHQTSVAAETITSNSFAPNCPVLGNLLMRYR